MVTLDDSVLGHKRRERYIAIEENRSTDRKPTTRVIFDGSKIAERSRGLRRLRRKG